MHFCSSIPSVFIFRHKVVEMATKRLMHVYVSTWQRIKRHYKKSIWLEHKHWLPKDLQRWHWILLHLHQHDCIMDISMTCPFSWIWYSTTLVLTNYNYFTFFEKKGAFHFEMLKCLILLRNGYKRCKVKIINPMQHWFCMCQTTRMLVKRCNHHQLHLHQCFPSTML